MKTLHCEIIKLFSYYFLIKTLKKKRGKRGEKRETLVLLKYQVLLKERGCGGEGWFRLLGFWQT